MPHVNVAQSPPTRPAPDLGRVADVIDLGKDTDVIDPRAGGGLVDPGIEAGVIEDARARQRRQRSLAAALLAATAVAAIIGLTSGASKARRRPATRPPYGLSVANPVAFHGEGDLAFVSDYRLLVLDGANGSLHVLSTAPEAASDPEFSPDGRWLTYSLNNGQVWLARANGTEPRLIASSEARVSWLPDGRLRLGSELYSVQRSGALSRSAAAPQGLISWSSNGAEDVFETDTLKVDPPGSSRGVERLEVASSLSGKRTLWYQAPTSFNATDGITANIISSVTVLPDHEGLLVATDPDESDDADGSSLYEIRSPLGPWKRLAVTLAPQSGGGVSIGTEGKFAIGAGGDRYAWANKAAELCNAITETCSPLQTPPGVLTIDPAWSRDRHLLAVVEAASEPQGYIGQSVVARWYATHQLAIVRPGSATPVVLAGTRGAAVPTWSNNGRSLLYVADNGLWLIRTAGARPTEIVAPLFTAGVLPAYYGQVNWVSQFAWSVAAPS